MSKPELRFENPDNTGRRLRCPACGEVIYPADLETYLLCPYCNAKLVKNADLEDFTLDPLARQWAERNNH